MERGAGLKILCFLFVIVLCVSLISAQGTFIEGILELFFGKGVTGQITDESTGCSDSDNGVDFTVAGYVKKDGWRFYDYCDGDIVYDFTCGTAELEGPLVVSLPLIGRSITGAVTEDGEGTCEDFEDCDPNDPTPSPPPSSNTNCMTDQEFLAPCMSGRCGCDPNEEFPCTLDPNAIICEYGTIKCVDTDGNGIGEEYVSFCHETVYGEEEICNGLDDDCDGETDEDPNMCPPGQVCQEGFCVPEEPTCNDNDNDGYGDPGSSDCTRGPETDCDDDTSDDPENCPTNPDGCSPLFFPFNKCAICINPGANEDSSLTCDDNADNDCDDDTDCDDSECEILGICSGCSDNDGDGYCRWFSGTYCGGDKPATCPDTCDGNDQCDCDDNPDQCGANCNPSETEICNGLDDNCDGSVDECGSDCSNCDAGLNCVSGTCQGLNCIDNDGDGYYGANSNHDCVDDSSEWDCDDSDPDIYPGAIEGCDGPEDCSLCDDIDNNCPGDPGFGYTNEGCNPECVDVDGDDYCTAPQSNQLTTPQISECLLECMMTNAWDCDDANPNINPSVDEDCDGLDNNCYGGIDDGLYRMCGSDQQAQADQPETVPDSAIGYFNSELEFIPLAENWDIDDYGSWEYGYPSKCTEGREWCDWDQYGTGGDGYGPCEIDYTPQTEVCDGEYDEDCDGSVDEGCACARGNTKECGDGICEKGTQNCGSDGKWEECVITETNDECDCNPGEIRNTCGRSVGKCSFGLEVCSETGKWVCNANLLPGEEAEACDGKDNDCDGKIDEDGVCDEDTSRDGESGGTYGEGSWESELGEEGGKGKKEKSTGESGGFIDWLIKLFLAIFRLGRVYVGGAISEEGTVMPPVISDIRCSDTDGGINYFVKGTVKGLDINGNLVVSMDNCYEEEINSEVDACLGIGCFLSEKYCGNDEQTIQIENRVECKHGCANGACLPVAESGESGLWFNTEKWAWERR
jgi:hypothetical protein